MTKYKRFFAVKTLLDSTLVRLGVRMGVCEKFRPKKELPLETRKKDAYAAIARAASLLGEIKRILDEDKDLWGKK